MEWLKELLKNAGLDADKIDGFVTEFNKEAPKHFIPKERYNELAEAKKKLEGDILERDKQLESLKAIAGNSEELKKQIEQLQDENKAAKEAYEKQARELTLNTAIKLSLAGKVYDPDIVLGLLNKETLQLDENGNIKAGLDDQLKSLRESKGFLFVPEKGGQPTFTGFKPFDGQAAGGGNNDGANNLGKQLAAMNKKAGEDMQKAQENYFK